MTRGINAFSGSGNVSGPIKYGETGQGDRACSFILVMDRLNGSTVQSTRVRVNIYGPVVKVCDTKLRKGGYVAVSGELMNRERMNEFEDAAQLLTEVRALDIVFV